MINIADVLANHRDEYEAELEEAKLMLKRRTDLFIGQAKECGLELYASFDGFFVTICFDDNQERDAYHARLINHHIYTIKVNHGVRVGLCSVPLKTVDGLAYTLKEYM
jgi:aspartate aminotransferase/aromatic-amino-acid transaminase